MRENRSFPTRREFLKGAAIAALTSPVATRRALAARRPAPSDRIVMGCIGVGGMGTANMNAFLECADVEIVAVCDVDLRNQLT